MLWVNNLTMLGVNKSCFILIQEVITDHIFHTLGLGNEGSVHHPIVMTEPFCNPSYSRNS